MINIDIIGNSAGLFVVAVLFVTFLWGMTRGFFGSVFKIFSSLVAYIITRLIYPFVVVFIRDTFLFEAISNKIVSILGINTEMYNYTQTQQTTLIYSLQLPDNLKKGIFDNNNNVVYSMLGADNVGDYIGRYLANTIINIAVAIILFILILALLRVVAGILDLFGKLPVIRYFNHAGGALIGVFWGVIIIWIVFAIVTIFVANPLFLSIYDSIIESPIARYMYDNNMLLNFILNNLL